MVAAPAASLCGLVVRAHSTPSLFALDLLALDASHRTNGCCPHPLDAHSGDTPVTSALKLIPSLIAVSLFITSMCGAAVLYGAMK